MDFHLVSEILDRGDVSSFRSLSRIVDVLESPSFLIYPGGDLVHHGSLDLNTTVCVTCGHMSRKLASRLAAVAKSESTLLLK